MKLLHASMLISEAFLLFSIGGFFLQPYLLFWTLLVAILISFTEFLSFCGWPATIEKLMERDHDGGEEKTVKYP